MHFCPVVGKILGPIAWTAMPPRHTTFPVLPLQPYLSGQANLPLQILVSGKSQKQIKYAVTHKEKIGENDQNMHHS